MNDEDYSYKKKEDKEDVIDDIRKHLDKSREIRQLNDANPHEQALKFEEVRKNPPKPDFMKVDLIHKTVDGLGKIFSRSKDIETKQIVEFEEDPFFTFAPYIGFMANIAKAPLNVMDVLLDETEMVAIEEKKAFKPEKRKDDKQWGWIFVLVCIVGSVVAGAYLLMRMIG